LSIAKPAVRMARQKAQIAGVNPNDIHADGMRVCKASPNERLLLMS
jgi:hypothetical protein